MRSKSCRHPPPHTVSPPPRPPHPPSPYPRSPEREGGIEAPCGEEMAGGIGDLDDDFLSPSRSKMSGHSRTPMTKRRSLALSERFFLTLEKRRPAIGERHRGLANELATDLGKLRAGRQVFTAALELPRRGAALLRSARWRLAAPLAGLGAALMSSASVAGKLVTSHRKLEALQSELAVRRFRLGESRDKLGSLYDKLVPFRGKLGPLHPKLTSCRGKLAANRCKPVRLVSTLHRSAASLKRRVARLRVTSQT